MSTETSEAPLPVSDLTIDSSHESPEQIQAMLEEDVVVESTAPPVEETVKAAPA